MLASVTFSERSAWAMIVILLGVGGLYIAQILMALAQGPALPPPGIMAVLFTVLVIALSIVSHILIAIIDPKTANQKRDERDKRVTQRAGHWSGIVLGVLTIAALLHYLVFRSGDLLFHMIFSSLILAHIVDYVLIIVSYRRGV